MDGWNEHEEKEDGKRESDRKHRDTGSRGRERSKQRRRKEDRVNTRSSLTKQKPVTPFLCFPSQRSFHDSSFLPHVWIASPLLSFPSLPFIHPSPPLHPSHQRSSSYLSDVPSTRRRSHLRKSGSTHLIKARRNCSP